MPTDPNPTDAAEAEVARLRGLLREARILQPDEGTVGLHADIDAALRAAGEAPPTT